MKINLDSFISSLQDNLNVAYLNRSGTELTVRCFNCGDSVNANHGHLNIKVDDPNYIVWRCVKCDSSGYVDTKFINNLKIKDESALRFAHKNSINIINKRKKIKQSSNNFSSFKKLKIPYSNDKKSLKKLKYLNNRLKTNLSVKDAVDYFKIVLDLRQLFRMNSWMKINEENYIMSRLANEGIGFISSDNTKIIFRDTSNSWKKRYFNYNVYGNFLDDNFSSAIYTVSKKIDLLFPMPLVVIAEGTIDIVSVVLNIFGRDSLNDNNIIFLNAFGKSYIKSLKKVRQLGFFDFNLKIFSDSDVNLSFYKKLKKYDPILYRKRILIYYNKLRKDFGYPKEYLSPKKTQL
jgi:hypothetical protein